MLAVKISKINYVLDHWSCRGWLVDGWPYVHSSRLIWICIQFQISHIRTRKFHINHIYESFDLQEIQLNFLFNSHHRTSDIYKIRSFVQYNWTEEDTEMRVNPHSCNILRGVPTLLRDWVGYSVPSTHCCITSSVRTCVRTVTSMRTFIFRMGFGLRMGYIWKHRSLV